MALFDDFFISEKNFRLSMESIVEPYLASLREDRFFRTFDEKKIHYEKYINKNAKGSIVIAHGFSESAEKFRETSYYFLKMGFNVFAIDHRGHGRSEGRDKNPYTVLLKSFDNYVDDLNCLVQTEVIPASGGLPTYLYAHSMGGAIGVQYLQSYPKVFKKAVLSSPMIKAKTAKIPENAAAFLVKVLIFFGRGDKKLLGRKTFDPNKTYETSHDTSEERFNYYQQKRKTNLCLQTSAPTAKWVAEAIRVSKLNLDPARCKKIETETLVCLSEEDSAVVNEAEEDFVRLTPKARLVKFTNCRHEIYNSVDETLRKYLTVIENFLFSE